MRNNEKIKESEETKMREIKFRVWDKMKKAWIGDSDGVTFISEDSTEGQLAINLEGNLRVFYPSCFDADPTIENDEPLHGIGNSEYESIHPCNTKPTYKRQYVLCQYTGLKDSKGVEIYEGDLLEWHDEILEVRWDKGEFIIWSKLFKGFGRPDGGTTGMINARGYFMKSKVIGNIYENPEPLRARKDR